MEFPQLSRNFPASQACGGLFNFFYRKDLRKFHLAVNNSAMGSPRTKKKLTTKQLRDFAAEMHKQASKVEATLAIAEQMGIEWLNVSHYPTGIDGIESITKFTAAIFNAIDEQNLRSALDGTRAIAESQAEALKLTDARRKPKKD